MATNGKYFAIPLHVVRQAVTEFQKSLPDHSERQPIFLLLTFLLTLNFFLDSLSLSICASAQVH